MEIIVVLIFFAGIPIWGIVAIGYFRYLAQFTRALKNRHDNVWEQIGRPSVSALKFSPVSAYKLVLYIARKKYCELNDLELSIIGDGTRRRFFICMTIFCVVVATLVLAARLRDP